MSLQTKYFEVTVAGQYIALSHATGTHALKNYSEKFIVPSQEGALSKICKHLLSPKLKKKYSDFIRFRTHEKISMVLHNYAPNAEVLHMSIEDMNLTELHDFCILRQLEIDPFQHGTKDIFKIRSMVLKANEDKRQYAKDKRENKNAPEEAEANKLRAMNELDEQLGGTEINLNEQLVKKPEVQSYTPTPIDNNLANNDSLESDEPLPPVEPEPGEDPFAV